MRREIENTPVVRQFNGPEATLREPGTPPSGPTDCTVCVLMAVRSQYMYHSEEGEEKQKEKEKEKEAKGKGKGSTDEGENENEGENEAKDEGRGRGRGRSMVSELPQAL